MKKLKAGMGAIFQAVLAKMFCLNIRYPELDSICTGNRNAVFAIFPVWGYTDCGSMCLP